jgi:raffinose/stachyose/melibiose transport system substrate-binding protein
MLFWLDELIGQKATQQKFLDTLNRVGNNSFTDTPYLEAFQTFKDLIDSAYFNPASGSSAYLDVVTSLGRNESAMVLQGNYLTSNFRTSFPNLKLGVLPFPVLPDAASSLRMEGYTTGLAVANASANKDAALEFLKFFARASNMIGYALETGNIPALNVTLPAGSLDPIQLETYVAASKEPNFIIRIGTYVPPALTTTYQDSVAAVFFGTMTPEEACEALEAKAEKLQAEGTLPM